jgi:adenylosuccinate lyase
LEAEEFFHRGQKGSSAMPHKRNPIAAENTTGLARVVRAALLPALENVALWHERDISHSSVERVIAPDATIALDYALCRFTNVMDRLIVYPERMKKNLDLTRGLIYSEGVLLQLVASGLTREEAYALVQRNAMKVWEKGEGDFLSALLADEEVVKHLGRDEQGRVHCRKQRTDSAAEKHSKPQGCRHPRQTDLFRHSVDVCGQRSSRRSPQALLGAGA